MKKIIIPAALSLLFACNSAGNKDSVDTAEARNEEKVEQKTDTMATERQMNKDNDFVVKAASCGLMEVQLGQMAAEKATNKSVKDFGQMMATHHAKLNDELKSLAASKNITIPTTPGNDEMDHINKLRDKTGKDFDKDYLDLMVDEHEDDLDAFEKASKDATDADIRAFAAKHVATLKQHHDQAKSLKDKLK